MVYRNAKRPIHFQVFMEILCELAIWVDQQSEWIEFILLLPSTLSFSGTLRLVLGLRSVKSSHSSLSSSNHKLLGLLCIPIDANLFNKTSTYTIWGRTMLVESFCLENRGKENSHRVQSVHEVGGFICIDGNICLLQIKNNRNMLNFLWLLESWKLQTIVLIQMIS